MSKLNKKLIFHITGLLLMFNGLAMCLASIISYMFNEGVFIKLITSAVFVIIFGSILMLLSKENTRKINKKDAYFIVLTGWITMVFSGTIPYIVTDSIQSYPNIFFETMSGYTTTGSTVINNIESLPKSIIFWRSMTHL